MVSTVKCSSLCQGSQGKSESKYSQSVAKKIKQTAWILCSEEFRMSCTSDCKWYWAQIMGYAAAQNICTVQ